jgi:hypothetical protein
MVLRRREGAEQGLRSGTGGVLEPRPTLPPTLRRVWSDIWHAFFYVMP